MTLNVNNIDSLPVKTCSTTPRMLESTTNIIKNIWNNMVLNNQEIPGNLRIAIGTLYSLGLNTNLHFLRMPNVGWIAENNWIGEAAIKNYAYSFDEYKMNAFQMWAELMTDEPITSITGKRCYYSTIIKVGEHIPDELVGKWVFIRNTTTISGKDKGIPIANFSTSITQKGLEENFLTPYTIKLSGYSSRKFTILRKELSKQLYEKYGSKIELIKGKAQPTFYISKFDMEALNKTWIKEFYKYIQSKNRNEALKILERNSPQTFNYYNSFDITELGQIPSTGNLKFILTTTEVQKGWLNLVNNLDGLKNSEIKMGDVFDMFYQPQIDTMRTVKNIVITEDNVNDIFTVDSSNKRNFLNERNPHGVSTFIRYALQNTDVLSILNQMHEGVKLPTDIVTKFSSQQRFSAPATTTYEDINAIKDSEGNDLVRKVAVHVKNSTENNPTRFMEDAFKTVFGIDDTFDTIFITVTVYHPDDVATTGSTIFSNDILGEMQHQGGGLGVINFGIYSGVKGVRRLGETYSAIK